MKLNKYKATLNHDKGTTELHVTATSKEKAIQRICNVENCPKRAITDIEFCYTVLTDNK